MNLLFLGASGFVGSHALHKACARKCRAWGTSAKTRHEHLRPFDLLHDDPEVLLDGLLRDPAMPSFGVLCASVRQIDQCYRERETTREINVARTIAALEAFERHGYKPVFLSTSFVFDGQKGYYDETEPPSPVCEYGRQKAEVEHWMRQHQPEGLILRLDKIVGDSPEESHLFTEWNALSREGRPLVCIADQILSPTHVDDIARAILLACQHNLSGVWHVANTEFFARDELARQFRLIMDRPGDVLSRPMTAFGFQDPRPLKTYLDSSRFIRQTGMRFTPMRETLLKLRRRLTSLEP